MFTNQEVKLLYIQEVNKWRRLPRIVNRDIIIEINERIKNDNTKK